MIKLFITCSFLIITFCSKSQLNNLETADSLFKCKQYFKASILAEFVLFDSDDLLQRKQAIQLKIACLKKQLNFEDLNKFIATCYTQSMSEDLRLELLYEEILTNFILKRYKEVIHLSEFYPKDSLMQIKLIEVLNIISNNELQNWSRASSLWQFFLSKYHLQDTLVKQLYNTIPHFKSERKANTLSSILPGLGQLYAGKPLEGITSFLFQSGSIFMGIKWWNLGYRVASISVCGSTASAFYDGGKKRARVLVKNYNSIKLYEYNNQLNKQILLAYQSSN